MPKIQVEETAQLGELPTESGKWLEVSLFWGQALLEVRTFAPGRPVRLGPAANCDFPFETAIDVAGSFEGRRLVSAGNLTLVLQWVSPAAPPRARPFDGVDLGFAELLSVGALLHAMLLIGIQITPTTDDQLSERLFANPNDTVKLVVRPLKRPDIKFPTLPSRSSIKPKGPVGKFGLTSAHKAEAAPSKPGSPIVDAKRRERDRSRILATGLLAALGENSHAASDVFGPGGIGSGINSLLGGLKPGAGMNSANGMFGLSSRGTGPGGGGTALSLGGFGTHGHGPGGGGPELGFGGPGESAVHIIQGKTSVGVALDKSVIAKVIRGHWSQIKYCYETQLNQDPQLAGKVAVAFTINGTGAVAQADVSESSLGNRKVEDCVISAIKRWRFPEPRGGGQVFVTYPWLFKAAGGEE